MMLADMHCDTVVNCDHGMRGLYQSSARHPKLQFYAVWSRMQMGSPEERLLRLLHFFEKYRRECRDSGIREILTASDLACAVAAGDSAGLFAIEGNNGLLPESEELSWLVRAGLRVVGMAWDDNELTAGSRSPGRGLTDAGRAFVRRAGELGLIFDISHMSDRAVYDLLSLTDRPVLATHSDYRAVTDVPRNLPDDIAREVARRGGVIGLNLYPPFLDQTYAGTDAVLRHLSYGLELCGEDAVGFGLDIDGTDGKYPEGITDGRSIHDQLLELLFAAFPARIAEKIAGGNVLRFLAETLPE